MDLVLDSAFRNGWRRGGLAERGRFALWLSVFMGAGVLCYLSRHALSRWPDRLVVGSLLCVAVLLRRLISAPVS